MAGRRIGAWQSSSSAGLVAAQAASQSPSRTSDFVKGDVGGGQRLLVALEPVHRRIHPRLAVDEADAPVAEAGQMRRRREASGDLAGHDRHVLARLGIAVQQHGRDALASSRRHAHLAGEDRRIDHAGDGTDRAIPARSTALLQVGVGAGRVGGNEQALLERVVANAVEADHRVRDLLREISSTMKAIVSFSIARSAVSTSLTGHSAACTRSCAPPRAPAPWVSAEMRAPDISLSTRETLDCEHAGDARHVRHGRPPGVALLPSASAVAARCPLAIVAASLPSGFCCDAAFSFVRCANNISA